MDEDKAVEYILSCITYEGGISLVPGAEAQGGTTYCALASLALMNKLDCLSKPVDVHADILGWCERKYVANLFYYLLFLSN